MMQYKDSLLDAHQARKSPANQLGFFGPDGAATLKLGYKGLAVEALQYHFAQALQE
jgi:hypothetical protein